MTVYLDKFLAIIIEKYNHNVIKVSNRETKSHSLTKLFGVETDDNLNFFENITKQHLNQNGTCFRVKGKKGFYENFFRTNFNYQISH